MSSEAQRDNPCHSERSEESAVVKITCRQKQILRRCTPQNDINFATPVHVIDAKCPRTSFPRKRESKLTLKQMDSGSRPLCGLDRNDGICANDRSAADFTS